MKLFRCFGETRATALGPIGTWRFNRLQRSDWLGLWIDVTLVRACLLAFGVEDHDPSTCPDTFLMCCSIDTDILIANSITS